MISRYFIPVYFMFALLRAGYIAQPSADQHKCRVAV